MRLAPALLLLPLIALAPGAARADVVARQGAGFLERRADGHLVLHVSGSPYQMGFQHGKLLRDLVRANVQRIVDNKSKLGRSTEYQAYLLMRPLMQAMLSRHIPARFVKEMHGVADGAGVPYDQVLAANLFPAAFHCSGIALRGKATADGSLYHVRILDYMTKVGLQDSAVVIIHSPAKGHRWLNVGFAGFIGSVTGMNEAKVAIGEMGGEGLGYWDGEPMSFLIRDALERADTLAQAVEIFREAKRTCEYYYVISDGKTRDAVGIWATPKQLETVRPGESYAMFEGMHPLNGAAGGKAFARDLRVETSPTRILFRAKGKVEGFIALQPKDVLVLSGDDRYEYFMRRLMPHYGKVDLPLLEEMVKRPVSMGSNLHVAIFHPETLEAWVAVAAHDGSPACDQPYAHYTLQPKAPSDSK